MEKDAMLTFRLPVTLRKALDAAAESERRSVGSLTVLILEEWLASKGRKIRQPTRRKAGRE